MNITAEQARLYARGWQESKEVIQKIEKQVETAAKWGEKSCTVAVDMKITREAADLVIADLERAGFCAIFGRSCLGRKAFFKISWSNTQEEDDTQEDYDNG